MSASTLDICDHKYPAAMPDFVFSETMNSFVLGDGYE